MILFRKGDDTRTIFVPIILAFIILIAYFTGAFGALNKFIFEAKQLPDFAFANSTSGISLLAVNLKDKGDLQYFTGEKWKTIDSSKDYDFTLGSYTFNPLDVKKKFIEFYEGERKPSNFKMSVNDWRYWDVFPRGTISGESLVSGGKVPIVSRAKNGFVGVELIEFGYLDYNNIFSYDYVSDYKPFILQNEFSGNIQTVIAWRDSILEGNACEKFLTLNTYQKVGDANTPVSLVPRKYTVRKIDQYIFVDLDRYVREGAVQNWDKVDCFKVEQYDDNLIDRSSWKNDAVVQFSYTENDWGSDSEKVLWKPNEGWVYGSHGTKSENIVLSKPETLNEITLEKSAFDSDGRNYVLLDGNKIIPQTSGSTLHEDNFYYFDYYDTSKITVYFERDKCDSNCLMLFAEIPGRTFSASLQDYSGLPVAYFDKSGVLKQGDLAIPSYTGAGSEMNAFTGSDFLRSLYGKTKSQVLNGYDYTGPKFIKFPYTDTSGYVGVSSPPENFNGKLLSKNFYQGLVELTRLGGIFEEQDAEFKAGQGVFVAGSPESVDIKFVNGAKWGKWSNKPLSKEDRINLFVYNVLTEYNKYNSPLVYFDKTPDGVQRLNKGNVYLKDTFIYYFVSGDSYIIGSLENGNFAVSAMPTYEELLTSYPAFDRASYDLTVGRLNYLRGKRVDSVTVKVIR